MERKRDFKHNVLASWGITYFAIFVIPILLFFVFIAICVSMLDNETRYYNNLAVEHVRSMLDGIFADINTAATELFQDEGLSAIGRYPDFHSVPSWQLYNEVSSVQRTGSVKPYIEGLIVYNPSMDLYISDSGYGQISRIHSLGEYSLQLTRDEADDIFFRNIAWMEIHDASFVFPNGRKVRRIIVTRPIDYVRSGFCIAAVVSLDNLMGDESKFGSYHNIMIFSSATGQLLYDFSASGNPEDATLDSISESSGDIFATAPSTETNFTYVIRMRRSEYYRGVYMMYGLMVIYVILAIVAAGLFSARRMRKNWRELESAIQRVGADTAEADGIYSPFVSSVSRLEEEKEGLGSIIEKQTASLKTTMLKSLVQGEVESASQNALEECGITFPSSRFMVLVAASDDPAAAEKELEAALPEGMAECFPFPSQYGAALLLSILPSYTSSHHDIYREIASAASSFDVAASDVVEGLGSIGQAYVSAIGTLEYKRNMDIKEVLFSRDVKALSGNIRYFYPPDSAFTLTTAVSEGKGDEAVAIIRDIYQKNMDSGVSARHMRYLLFAISSDIIRLSAQLEGTLGDEFVPFTVPMILQTRNPEAVRMSLEENVKDFCRGVVAARNALGDMQDDTYKLYQKALQIIGGRYSDPMLNVSEIADSMDISLAYLSKIFKKFHRMNISDYISHIRVEAAKRMLENGGEQMQEIASACGFGSLRTFMRVFRTLEGVTPGQYRSYKQEGSI